MRRKKKVRVTNGHHGGDEREVPRKKKMRGAKGHLTTGVASVRYGNDGPHF